MSFLLYALLTTCTFYLGSAAKITEWLWSRYRRWPRLEAFMTCPACASFWIAMGWAFALRRDVMGLSGHVWYTPVLVGMCMSVVNPMVFALMYVSLQRTMGSEE